MKNLIFLVLLLLIGSVYANKNQGYQQYSQQNSKLAITKLTLSTNAGDVRMQQVVDSLPQHHKVNNSKAFSSKRDAASEVDQIDSIGCLAYESSVLTEIFDNKYSSLDLFFYSAIIIILSAVISILLIKFINKMTKLKQHSHIVNNQMISKSCKWLAVFIIIFTLLDYIGVWGKISNETPYISYAISTIIKVSAYFILYVKLDKVFNTVLKRLYLILIGLMLVCILYGISMIIVDGLYGNSPYTHTLSVYMVAVIFILTCVLFVTSTVILYKTGLNYEVIGNSTNNNLFVYSSKCMKVGVYLLPVLVGIFLIYIATYLFLIACIIDKPKKYIHVTD